MPKLSTAHAAAVLAGQLAQRECLAYHHILRAIVTHAGKWGYLQHVGSAYDSGDSWTWQLAFSPRLRDAVIMETFKSRANDDETVRCFFLIDVAESYQNQSFDSQSVQGKIQSLFMHAREMELIEMNRAA